MILPANTGDVSSMVAQAMSILHTIGQDEQSPRRRIASGPVGFAASEAVTAIESSRFQKAESVVSEVSVSGFHEHTKGRQQFRGWDSENSEAEKDRKLRVKIEERKLRWFFEWPQLRICSRKL